jgi:hypothetical protein
MPSRKPYWCVAEISKEGKIIPISPAFEHVEDAEKRKGELLEKQEYRNKNLRVIKASHPVNPRKPSQRRGG